MERLTSKEAALIEAARREVQAKAALRASATASRRTKAPLDEPQPAPSARPNGTLDSSVYERVAQLIEMERRENALYRARLKRFGTAASLLLILALLIASMFLLLPMMLH